MEKIKKGNYDDVPKLLAGFRAVGNRFNHLVELAEAAQTLKEKQKKQLDDFSESLQNVVDEKNENQTY